MVTGVFDAQTVGAGQTAVYNKNFSNDIPTGYEPILYTLRNTGNGNLFCSYIVDRTHQTCEIQLVNKTSTAYSATPTVHILCLKVL